MSQLNNYTLAPIEEERISEAAGVNSAGGSFGLSFGLAVAGAVMLATLAFSFTNLAESSEVLSPEEAQQVATALDEDAQLMSNTGLEEAIVGQPPDVEAEIIRINTEARPIALQVALLVPLIAGLIGLFNSFRMIRAARREAEGGSRGLQPGLTAHLQAQTTLPGLRMPSGSSAALIARMTATASAPRCSSRNSRRAAPMPCSPVTVPPRPIATR